MADEYSNSIKNLFQSLRDISDSLRQLEMRVRVLEEKRYQAEGELKNLLDRTELQIGRLVSEAESEKRTRMQVAKDLKDELTNVESRFATMSTKLDAINIKIAYWSGGVAVLLVIVQLLLKFWK